MWHCIAVQIRVCNCCVSNGQGLGVPTGMLAPSPYAQTCLHGSGVLRDSPLEGHSPWDFASITPGSARNSLFYFVLVCFVLFCEHRLDLDLDLKLPDAHLHAFRDFNNFIQNLEQAFPWAKSQEVVLRACSFFHDCFD